MLKALYPSHSTCFIVCYSKKIQKIQVIIFLNVQIIASEDLAMSVILAASKINGIFLNSLAVFLAIVYINMGAALDLELIKTILKKPIGPVVGLCCQYIIMPLVSHIFFRT